MSKGRRGKPKSIPLSIGNDPSLWHFGSVREALAANTVLIAQLIRAGEELSDPGKSVPEKDKR
jgi:hypothetical protein